MSIMSNATSSKSSAHKIAVLAATPLVAALVLMGATNSNATPTALAASTSDPLGWAQNEYTANCNALLSGRVPVGSTQRARMLNNVADARTEIAANGGVMPPAQCPTPTPSPSTSPSASPTPSQTPTASPTASLTPSASPTGTTASPTPTGSPTTSPTGGGGNTGASITQANTGYLAWTGPNGERCTDTTLRVFTTRVNASTLGASATCVWLQQGINVDAPILLTAARIDRVVGSGGPKLTIKWSTIDGHGNGTYTVGGQNVDVERSQILGSSDGVRFEGMNLKEDWIRVLSTSAGDHNDGIQAYIASTGGSIIGCNIDGKPTNAPSGVGGNAAIFLADGSMGTTEIRDNYLAGGGYTLRLHESMRYRVTNNVIAAGTWLFGPLSTDNAVPGAFLEWSGNKTSDGTVLNP